MKFSDLTDYKIRANWLDFDHRIAEGRANSGLLCRLVAFDSDEIGHA